MMRFSNFFRTRTLPFELLAACLFAVLLASPLSAEPDDHALDLSIDLKPDTLAGSQDEGLNAQPQPVYPNGAPKIDTMERDQAKEDEAKPEDTEAVEPSKEALEPAKPTVVATIDKGTQSMSVFVDGVEKYNWPVSTGIAGYSTPSGNYTTRSMNKIWYSKQWDNAPMPHAVFFTKKGHAIHGTNETKNLGKPASHGCVRLSPKNAETFFNLVKDAGLENTQVVLTGVTPGGEYKITQPPRDRYPSYSGDRYRDRYGYYEPPPPAARQRRRLFQPYYDTPPRENRKQRKRRRWFFRN
jgi:lipoprotein-anchoring transpeptidase ErfK/SrfK